MFRKINKLQAEIDEMLELCDQAGATSQEEPVTAEEKKHERLGVMIMKAQDGVLEERYLLRMEKWLACDPAALRYYLEFQNLTALLYEHFDKNRLSRFIDFLKTAVSVGR